MGNHWNNNGDLVIEEKTLFRQVGWLMGEVLLPLNPRPLGGSVPFSPIYQQIAKWIEGEGWDD